MCIRSQTLETSSNTANSTVNTLSTSEWCADADDWEDDNNGNNSEENGNVIGRIESYCSDEEDETEDYDDDVQVQLGNLSVDERNANWEGGGMVTAGAGAGAVGRLHSPSATAEIEGDESEVVSVIPFKNGPFHIFCIECAQLEITITIHRLMKLLSVCVGLSD